MSNSATPSTGGGGSAAFSRLNRPGSGRLLTAPNVDGSSRGSAASLSSSSSATSLSPTSPCAGGLVPEHRVRPLPGSLGLATGGGRAAGSGVRFGPKGPMSPEQQEKRQGLKISFSQPCMRKAAAQNLAAGATPPPPPLQLAQLPSSSSSSSISASPLASLSQAAAAASSSEARLSRLLLNKSAHSTGRLVLADDNREYDFKAEDLVDRGEIGRGAFGTVNQMLFAKDDFQKVMAVKRIRSTVDEREQKELLMDLDVVMRSNDCQFIVLFFGAIFKEGDCWICMEMMDTSTDKFYKFIYEQLEERIPENVLGKITVATVRALNYLKEKLKIIHRDVKPSNILLDRRGNIKLCDFGISGQLVDSIAKTRDAGCRPYMAPERIDPQRAKGYDVRSDVWSLGITLIELATGKFPYPKWNSVYEQLQQVVHGDPPRLDPKENGKAFTVEFINFVNTCLIKEESQRPKYNKLLEHPFIKRSQGERVDVADYVTCVLERMMDDDDQQMDTA